MSDLGIRVERVAPGREAREALAMKSYAAAVVDAGLSSSLSEALAEIRQRRASLPIIILNHDPESEAGFRVGTELLEPLLMSGEVTNDLVLVLERLKLLLPDLRAQVLAVKDLLWINTANPGMKELLGMIDVIKEEPGSVLIQGENGTGKEVVARLLHFSGRRYTAPFVAINCAAIPETLLESELFGHEKGSFTGATEKRIGKFELAHQGTVFLDEIGDMPLNTQAKILRVLESSEIERVGGHEKIPVDIRIVAATNKDLPRQIECGLFRQDLYYRINTFTLSLPPLRDRPEDLLPLAQHFLDLHTRNRRKAGRKRLSQEAQQLLLHHDWPGNVRELRNAMERAAVLAAGNLIGSEVLPEEIRRQRQRHDGRAQPLPAATENAPVRIIPLKELERKAIAEALVQLDHNASRAARQLGISKATFFRKLKRYGISRRRLIGG